MSPLGGFLGLLGTLEAARDAERAAHERADYWDAIERDAAGERDAAAAALEAARAARIRAEHAAEDALAALPDAAARRAALYAAGLQ